MDEQQIISQEGYDKMEKELEELLKVRRPEIARRIESAKELGDLSENAEYSDAKEAQAFNDGRISELSSLLKNLTVVENGNGKETVGMGSNVVAKIKSNEKKYTIVSFNEADPLSGRISNESPLGRAFLGKRKGDKVIVMTPGGEVEYEILNIE